MDQPNHNNTPDGSGDVPLKRKRGRPRKYPRPDSEESSYIVVNQNKKQNAVRVEQAPVPPGFEVVNGNQQLQRGQENHSNDAMVGQVVSGVIEAVFDAGYLLSVRVGDSDTTLRGLVFKPGRYVPISSENDVAPGVPMIQRNEVPFPSRTTQFQTPLPKERNEQQPLNVHRVETLTMNGSQSVPHVPRGAVSSSNLFASSGKNVPSVTGQTSHQLPRGNVVPMLLTPNNFSNGLLVSNQPSQVQTQVSLGSGVIAAKEIPMDGNQAPTFHTQTSQSLLSSGMQSEGVAHNQSLPNVVTENEANSMRMPSVPFEQLVTEVVKRMQTPSDAMEVETDNSMLGDNTAVKDPSVRQDDKINDMDQPVLITPLQAVLSHPQENLATAPKPSDYTETGKMSELLQALQNNNMENEEAELGSVNKLDDIRNIGTEHEDGGSVQSTKPF